MSKALGAGLQLPACTALWLEYWNKNYFMFYFPKFS